MNSVNLIGNLTRDPETRMAGETSITKFGIAVQDSYKRDKSHFIDCISFGKQGEIIAQYFSRGNKIGITGSLSFNAWEQDGQKRSKLEVKVDNFTFVESAKQNQSSDMDSSDIPF